MPHVTIGPFGEHQTIVDEMDVALVEEHSWFWDGRYVKRRVAGKRHGPDVPRDPSTVFYLHREIMHPKDGEVVDHIDGDTKNNTRGNLRLCSRHENSMNRIGIGVSIRKDRPNGSKKFIARIMHNYRVITIGYFETEAEALQAVANKKKELRGKFSNV